MVTPSINLKSDLKPLYKIVKIVLIIVGGFLLLRFLKSTLMGAVGSIADALDKGVEKTLNETSASDGTQLEGNSFTPQAKTIADAQYLELSKGWYQNTSEDALFSSVINLNGAQLREVYREFDTRDGKTLFNFYAEELSTSLIGMNYYEDGLDSCSSYFDNCNEAEFMRDIWNKSGLPLTF